MQVSLRTSEPDLAPASPARATYEAAFTALRGALRAFLEGGVSGGELRGAMRLFCEEGRRRGLPAEQLIIMLKHVWHSLPGVGVCRHGGEGDELLGRVVAICIAEFYAAPDARERPGGGVGGPPAGPGTRVPARRMDCGGDPEEPSSLASQPAARRRGRADPPAASPVRG